MKKNILVIIMLVLLAIALVGGGIFLVIFPNNNTEDTAIREPKKESYGENKIIVGEKLNEEHQYKNITIKNILFQQIGDTYIFEMTLENNSKESFEAVETDIIFYTNTKKEIGRKTFTCPHLESGSTESVVLELKDKKFFNACDFTLKELASSEYPTEEVSKKPEPDSTG